MRHHQRRRGKIVRLHIGRDAALEVAVAGQHRGGDQPLVVDRLGDRRRQRTGIADAGGAAEADEVKADLVEFFLQAGLFEIFGNDLRAGSQRGLDPGLLLETAQVGVAGQQAGADQHAGFDVFVQEVMAAITTSPWPMSKLSPSTA